MNIEDNDQISERAETLRRAFDESFAKAHRQEEETHEEFIAIRVADQPYAIGMNGISGLFDNKTVTPLPGSVAGLLGIASFRGTIVPVFNLRDLLGHPGGVPPRWLVLLPAPSPVALAFDRFEGHLRVPRSALPMKRPVLHLPSILDEIARRAGGGPRRSND